MNTKIKRRFTGKLNGFTDKHERRFWNKCLKAYLKGYERFKFGKSLTTGQDVWYDVPQIIDQVTD